MNKPIKVLIIEDSEDDAKLALRALRRGGFAPTFTRVQTAAAVETALAGERWDAVISDFKMPGFTGMDALRIFRSTGLDIPFILISGTIGEETAVNAMKAGASDYVMKKSLLRLAPALERELEETRVRAAHREAQRELVESEARFRSLTELSSDWYWEQDRELRLSFHSSSFAQRSGTTSDKLLGKCRWDEPNRFPLRGTWEQHRSTLEAHQPFRDFEYVRIGDDGEKHFVSLSGTPIYDAAGHFNGYRGVGTNITERKRAEEALRWSETQLQGTLDATADGILAVDNKGKVINSNRRFAELWRVPQSLLDSRDDDALLAFVLSQLSEPEAFLKKVRALYDSDALDMDILAFKDGRVFERYSAPMLMAGSISGRVWSFSDVTERMRAEEALHAGQRKYRLLVENLPQKIFLKNRQSDYISCNENYAQSLGIASSDIAGKTDFDFYPRELAEKYRTDDERVMETGVTEETEESHILDGKVSWVHTVKAPVRNDAGERFGVLGIFWDITERRQAEEARKHREAELEESQRIARIGSWEWTIATGAVAWSDGMNHVLGRGRGSPPPTFETLQQFYKPESWQRLGVVIASTIETGTPYDLELEMIRADGAACWTTTRGEAIRGAGGSVTKLRGTVHDVTERKQAEERIVHLNRVYAVLSGINTLLVRVRDRDELFKEACRIAVDAGEFRMSLISIVDRSAMKIVPVASAGKDEVLMSAIKSILLSTEGAPTTMLARAIKEKKALVSNDSQRDPRVLFGRKYAESGVRSMAILPLIVADEVVGALALYASEIEFFQEDEMKLLTELAGDIAFGIDHIEKQERLEYLAYYDVLTGLANRSLFLERLAQYKRSAVSGGHKLVVYLVDLERFKNINDSLGRPAGDALLRQVAQWLTRNAGDANMVARVGADLFALVMPEVKQGGDLARLLEKWTEAFMEHPFRLNDAVFRIAAKVGIAIFPNDGGDADTLFKNAEAALKKAKASGERYMFYTQRMTEAVAGKLSLENQLRQALDNEEFVLHYQPKVNLVSGKLTGAEALIRWNDPRTGLVPPGRFIPVLEEIGLIYDVGRWALHQAIEDYLRWRSAGLPAVRIAVNVSPLQLRNRGFVAEIGQAIGIDAQAAAGLELEITESLIMEDIKHNIASLQAIRAMGVTIAIDDFGTGFSSLAYLAKLPVDTLKIDRSFVVDMTVGPQGLALVSTIINLAHSLKLKVVAEGVETAEQSRLLRLLACDEMQGFLFSKPLPAEIFESRFLAPALAPAA